MKTTDINHRYMLHVTKRHIGSNGVYGCCGGSGCAVVVVQAIIVAEVNINEATVIVSLIVIVQVQLVLTATASIRSSCRSSSRSS